MLINLSKVKVPGWAGAIGGGNTMAHLGVKVPLVTVLLEFPEPIAVKQLPR